MARELTSLLGAPVSVKVKRGEGLGTLGSLEGIACLSVALVTTRDSVGGAESETHSVPL
jgi:2C-methyl-D-erythritol 2,4-cyclodiphosphate synthase